MINSFSDQATKEALRIPPQNLEAEMAVLGGILLDDEAIFRVLSIVKPDDFYRRNHGKIFSVVSELSENREPVDIITLSNALKKSNDLEKVGGLAYLTTLVEITPTAANIEYYARIVKEKSDSRNTIDLCHMTIQDLYSEQKNVSEILNTLMTAGLSVGTHGDSTVHIRESLKTEFERIEKKHGSDRLFAGMRTGFENMDVLLGGMQTKNLVVIAGRPSTGKTALLVNLIGELSYQGGVLIFSFDQSKEEFSRRIISRETKINNLALRDGEIDKEEWPKIIEAVDSFYKMPIYINDDGNLYIQDVINTIYRYKQKYNIKTVMIDYLQLIGRLEKQTETIELGEMTRQLKAVSNKLDISVILLSQLNRSSEKRDKKQPQMSDLRGSGVIEQAAHVIMMLYWNEEKEILELIVTKHKDGPVGVIYVAFDKTTYNMQDIGGNFPRR